MELTSPILNTLKITSKKGYLLVDPESGDEAKIVILSDNSEKDIVQDANNLVIFGPGDYEASGILIKGTRPESETMYSIDTGDGRMLLVSSNSIAKLADADDFDVIVVKAVNEISESALAALTSKLVVVYGDESFIPEPLRANKVSKINPRKREEMETNVVYLEKK